MKRLEENRGRQDCSAAVKCILAPRDFLHGEDSSAPTTLSYKAPSLRHWVFSLPDKSPRSPFPQLRVNPRLTCPTDF